MEISKWNQAWQIGRPTMRSRICSLICRLFGKHCSLERPSSRDLIQEMKQEQRRVEVKTYELRKERENIASTIGGRNHG